jgi:hypothetical protein
MSAVQSISTLDGPICCCLAVVSAFGESEGYRDINAKPQGTYLRHNLNVNIVLLHSCSCVFYIYLMMLEHGTAVSPLECITGHILFNNVWFSLQPTCVKLHNDEKVYNKEILMSTRRMEGKPISLGILEKIKIVAYRDEKFHAKVVERDEAHFMDKICFPQIIQISSSVAMQRHCKHAYSAIKRPCILRVPWKMWL